MKLVQCAYACTWICLCTEWVVRRLWLPMYVNTWKTKVSSRDYWQSKLGTHAQDGCSTCHPHPPPHWPPFTWSKTTSPTPSCVELLYALTVHDVQFISPAHAGRAQTGYLCPCDLCRVDVADGVQEVMRLINNDHVSFERNAHSLPCGSM